jgi:hypothetical protein
MIVQKSRYVPMYVVGGGGIFDKIANVVRRITGNTVGDLASKLLLSASKSMATLAGKKLASRFLPQPSTIQPTITPLASAPTPVQLMTAPAPTATQLAQPPVVNHATKLDEIMAKYNTGSRLVSPTIVHAKRTSAVYGVNCAC